MSGGRAAYIQALDGWRAVSVAFVAIGHLAEFSSIAAPDTVSAPLHNLALLSVQFFFVISGFVICRGLLADERPGWFPAFYVRRAFRILPPLVLYVAVVIALAYTRSVNPDAMHVWRGLLFVCNIDLPACGWYLGGHLWSLSYEEQFYLVFPAAMLMLGAARRRTLTGLAFVFPAASLALYAIRRGDIAQFLGSFMSISMGVAWALNEDAVARVVARVPAVAFPLVLAAVVAVNQETVAHVATLLRVTLFAPALAFLLAKSATGVPGVTRFLSSAPVTAAGRRSYGFYLWQQLATYPFPGAGAVFYAFSFAACGLVVWLSYRFVEKPLIGLGRRLAGGLMAQAPLDVKAGSTA